MEANLNFIGCIRTPYQTISECPRNIRFDGALCELNLDAAYACELRGLKAGDHIMVLYWLGRPKDGVGYVPLTDESEPGTFAMRTPYRPNPIGAAVVPIEQLDGPRVSVRGLDCLDKTELLDIKPVIFREHSISQQPKPQQPQPKGLTGCDCDKPHA